MQCITKWESCYRRWGAVAHTVAVLSLVMLTVTGIQLESIGGWIACPPQLVWLLAETGLASVVEPALG